MFLKGLCPIRQVSDKPIEGRFGLDLTLARMQFTLRPAVESDFDFAFQAKREALGPHIIAKWGWDETFQLAIHGNRWRERPWSIIESDGTAVGSVSVAEAADHIRFGEFYLLPQFQRQGLGTNILLSVLARSNDLSLPVRLEYLKWNPVGSLYRRHGFEVISENDTHYFMARQPHAR